MVFDMSTHHQSTADVATFLASADMAVYSQPTAGQSCESSAATLSMVELCIHGTLKGVRITHVGLDSFQSGT